MSDKSKASEFVQASRIDGRISTLARFGDTGDGGVNRQIFSVEDRLARTKLVEWAQELDLRIMVDPIGNLFFRLQPETCGGSDPAVGTGSHLDSQPTGGRYDGVFGVVAGFEAVHAIIESGVKIRRPIEIVAWSNEEGSRYQPGCMGSMVYTGARKLDEFLSLEDKVGLVLADELSKTLAIHSDCERRKFCTPLHSFIELHIEQGPILQTEGLQVGIVSGIQGCRWYTVDIYGESRHAGTTPLSKRADAFREGLSAITTMYSFLDDSEDTIRLTIGSFEVSPGSPNTVPHHVRFTIDLRHPDESFLHQAEKIIREAVDTSMNLCWSEMLTTFAHVPLEFNPHIQEILQNNANQLGVKTMSLMSGAFHDAMYLANFCDTAMIFVPSLDGISHHPGEYTHSSDLATGTRLLADSLLELASTEK